SNPNHLSPTSRVLGRPMALTWKRVLLASLNGNEVCLGTRALPRPAAGAVALTLLALAPWGPPAAHADMMTFNNLTPVAIPGSGTQGPGAPYPSAISVSGLTGPITDVTVTLNNLTHTFIPDVGVLLVGPGGQSVVLMDFVGTLGVFNVTYTLSDA